MQGGEIRNGYSEKTDFPTRLRPGGNNKDERAALSRYSKSKKRRSHDRWEENRHIFLHYAHG